VSGLRLISEINNMTRTKILATIGPASFDKIEQLIEAGVDGIRFNLSHIRPEEYEHRTNMIKRIKEIDESIFIVGDLEGPKIRLGDFNSIEVKSGDEVAIIPASVYQRKGIPIQFEDFYKYVKSGNLLLVDDGNIGLRIRSVDDKIVRCDVEYGGIMESRKGVNTPSISIPMPYLSRNDMSHLEFLIENDFDYVSASFSRTADDIKQIGEIVNKYNIKKIGKPENHEGKENLREIIQEADAMMIPRGDYGVECGVSHVPAFQKQTIRACNILGKIVITATQMLESMMICKEPKRAEVSDVFNAPLDGTDVVMLSGETSKGKYPIEAVRVMNQILDEAEKYMFDRQNGVNLGEILNNLIEEKNPADSISKEVYNAAKADYIKAIIVPTSTGYTAQKIARFRIDKPVIAVTYDKKIRRQLNAVWGVIPLLTSHLGENYVVENSLRLAKEKGYVSHGDYVIVTAGMGCSGKGSTNMLRIEKV